MSDWVDLTFFAVVVVLALQIAQMRLSAHRDSRREARIDGLDTRVSAVERAITEGQINRVSVVAFRAELASRIAQELGPIQAQLRQQDRKLDEIAAAINNLFGDRNG